MNDASLLVIGNLSKEHVGGYFMEAASQSGIRAAGVDATSAYRAPAVIRKIYWHLLGHRPFRLAAFSREVREALDVHKPAVLVTTGISPIDRQTLDYARKMGVRTVNFLTDDPWNSAHRTSRFFKSLSIFAIAP